jgi:hypothetical protein
VGSNRSGKNAAIKRRRRLKNEAGRQRAAERREGKAK